MLVGLLGKYGYKKNPLKKDGMISRNLTDLLIYLGLSAWFLELYSEVTSVWNSCLLSGSTTRQW